MSTGIPATEEWFDGPGFVKWLDEEMGIGQDSYEPRLNEHNMKEMRRFSQGKKPVSIWQADLILTKFALHIDLIPPELRVPAPLVSPYGAKAQQTRDRIGSRGFPYPVSMRREVVRTREAEHLTAQATAEQFGINESTVRKWARELRQAEAYA